MSYFSSFLSLPFSEPHEEIPVAPPTTAASSMEEPEGETIPLGFCLLHWLYSRDMSEDMGWGREAQTLCDPLPTLPARLCFVCMAPSAALKKKEPPSL